MQSLPDFNEQVRRHLAHATPVMDLNKIISELQAEKHRLDEAIQALERLSTLGSKPKRRGRPPGWLNPKTESPKASAATADGSDHPGPERVPGKH